jgi:hypothetical protein
LGTKEAVDFSIINKLFYGNILLPKFLLKVWRAISNGQNNGLLNQKDTNDESL